MAECERRPGESVLEWDRRCSSESGATDDSGKQIPTSRTRTIGDIFGPIFDTLRRVGITLPENAAGLPIRRSTGLAPLESVEGYQAVSDAYGRLISGTASAMDVLALKTAGVITADEASDMLFGGGGVGGGGDPLAGAKFAETVRGNRVQEAAQAISQLMARVNAAQGATLDAAPYALPPGATHFPGFGPESPAVRLGLTEPVAVAPIAFDPERVMRMGADEGALAAERGRLLRLAGY